MKNIEDLGYGKGYAVLKDSFGKMLNKLSDLIDIGINVVVIAHVIIKKFEQPDETGAYDRWEIKLAESGSKKVAPALIEWADMLLFANYETIVIKEGDKAKARGGTKRVMYTQHSATWDAKNRHDLEPKLPFEFSAIADVIPSKFSVSESAQKPIEITPMPESERVEAKPTASYSEESKLEQDSSGIYHVKATDFKDVIPNHLKPLYDLMDKDGISVNEFCLVAEERGYVAKGTKIDDYQPNFIASWGVASWPKIVEYIEDNIRNPYAKDVPFI